MFGHDGYYTNLSDMFHNSDLGFTLVSMTNTETQPFSVFNQLYNAIRNYIKTVGIAENKGTPKMAIFPNPAGKTTVLDLGDTKNADVSIVDLSGKLIFSTSVSQRIYELNTELFPEGLYVVEVKTADATRRQKLLVTK